VKNTAVSIDCNYKVIVLCIRPTNSSCCVEQARIDSVNCSYVLGKRVMLQITNISTLDTESQRIVHCAPVRLYRHPSLICTKEMHSDK